MEFLPCFLHLNRKILLNKLGVELLDKAFEDCEFVLWYKQMEAEEQKINNTPLEDKLNCSDHCRSTNNNTNKE